LRHIGIESIRVPSISKMPHLKSRKTASVLFVSFSRIIAQIGQKGNPFVSEAKKDAPKTGASLPLFLRCAQQSLAPAGKSPKRRRWRKQRGDFEEAARLADMKWPGIGMPQRRAAEMCGTKKRDRRSGLFESLIEISAWRTEEHDGRPRSVKKTCRWHVFSGGHSGYAARRGTAKAAEGRGIRKGRLKQEGGTKKETAEAVSLKV
jgi:hypothetical protein